MRNFSKNPTKDKEKGTRPGKAFLANLSTVMTAVKLKGMKGMKGMTK